MRKFFKNTQEIEKYTSQLRMNLSCPYCHQSSYLIGHGLVYKKTYEATKIIVGKRVLCSNRGSSKGCGRTIRLFLSSQLPLTQFKSSQVAQFFKSLTQNNNIEESYFLATKTLNSRNAYRWIGKLKSNLIKIKDFLYRYNIYIFSESDKKYNHPYIEVISSLIKLFQDSYIEQFQLLNQYHFF